MDLKRLSAGIDVAEGHEKAEAMITLYGRTNFQVQGETLDQEELASLLFNASRLLTARQYVSAAGIVRKYPFRLFDASNDFGDDFTVLLAEVSLEPYEELRTISNDEEGRFSFHRIAEAISEIGPYVRVIACELKRAPLEKDWPQGGSKSEAQVTQDTEQHPIAGLIDDIVAQRDLMIDVATGGTRIQGVEKDYEARRIRIAEQLEQLAIPDPNQFTTLWKWYDRWKAGDLPSYQSRRRFVIDLYEPLLDNLRRADLVHPAIPPTGWMRVDRTLYAAKRRLQAAKSEEDYQGLGLLCREVLISLAQAVFDPAVHRARDGVAPSATDASRMLEAYVDAVLPGAGNEAGRRFTKASLALANDLQHDRGATYRDAALCIEATENVVNTIAIIAGRRDRP